MSAAAGAAESGRADLGTDGERRARFGRPWSRQAVVSWSLVAVFTVFLLAVSWHRWGSPLNDVGLDLTVAQRWLHGTIPYRDVRYWYGPLGIGVLAAAFSVFGASLSVAIGVGFVQTAVLAELTRRLASRWLPTPVVAATVAVVLSIGFSGSLFNFQLPHTFAATTGLIALLAALLAFTRQRWIVAGLAIGATALTRPEFFAFGIAALGGAALGVVRESGWKAAFAAVVRTGIAALVLAGPILGYFAWKAGAHRLFLENIFPVEFLKVSGTKFEHDQHPFDLASFGTLLVRGTVVAAGVSLWLGAWAWLAARRDGGTWAERVPFAPRRAVVLVAAGVIIGFALAVVGGDARQPLDLTKSDTTRFLISMTALPAVAFAVLALAARSWLQGGAAPLSAVESKPQVDSESAAAPVAAHQPAGSQSTAPGWVGAGALIAASAACGLRSYAQFSTDVYGSYYAAPLVVLAAIVAYRAATQLGRRQIAATASVLVLAAATLSLHAWLGLYDDFNTPVHTPAGTFNAPADTGPEIQGVINLLKNRVKPGDRVLSLPQEPGFVFLLKGRPALYNATFLPGVLATHAEDQAEARDLMEGSRGTVAVSPGHYVPPLYVVEANWNFGLWGFKANGVDVNVALHRAIVANYDVIGRFGDTTHLPPRVSIGRAFTVYELKPNQRGYVGDPILGAVPGSG